MFSECASASSRIERELSEVVLFLGDVDVVVSFFVFVIDLNWECGGEIGIVVVGCD